MKQIDDSAASSLKETIPEIIRKLDSKKDQYKALENIHRNNKIKYSQLAEVYARGFVATVCKKDVDISLDEIADQCQSLGLSANNIIKLAKKLRDIDSLTKDTAFRFAKSGFKISKNIITDNIEFWQNVLGEEFEEKLVQETGDIAFALASKHQSIVESAHTLINSDNPLPTKVIDEIINRKEAHILAGTPRFVQVQTRVRTTQQFKDVFESLNSNGKRKELAEFIVAFFSIPTILAGDDDEIIAIGERILNE